MRGLRYTNKKISSYILVDRMLSAVCGSCKKRLLTFAIAIFYICIGLPISAYGGFDGAKPLAGVKIGIDPGHQSKGDNTAEKVAPWSSQTKPRVSSGTSGVVSGVPEYRVNLDVALMLKQNLEALGAEVIMAREENDVNISNVERALMMNEAEVDLCIRIHCNGSENSSVKGALMMVPSGEHTAGIRDQSLAAAEIILKNFIKETGARDAGFIHSSDLTGFNWSTVPVCLIEMGFMSNPDEDRLLADADYQRKCALGIANGILEWAIGLELTAGDIKRDWEYIVPFGIYEHCQILPVNGLIKVGSKIGEYRLGGDGPLVYEMVFGLLDREGMPITGLIFNTIEYPNSDGYMIATLKDENGSDKRVLLNHLGELLPMPDDSVITLFDRSYSVETNDFFTLYVNNLSYPVPKNVLERTGIRFTDVYKYSVQAVYSSCFIISYAEDMYVFGWEGNLRFKTDKCYMVTPEGLLLSDIQNNRVSLMDFDGNEIASFASYYVIPQGKGIYYYESFPQSGLIDINNPEAFKDIPFSGILDIDTQNRLIKIYETNYKVGLYDFDGNEILPFKCSEIGNACDGLIRFQDGDMSGYADMEGNIVYEIKNFWLSDFSEGLAAYSAEDGTNGFINLSFEPVIQSDGEWAISYMSEFHDGLAPVMVQGEIAFINREGRIVITREPDEVRWEHTTGFMDGLAVVAGHAPYAVNNSILYEQANNNMNGIITYIIKDLLKE